MLFYFYFPVLLNISHWFISDSHLSPYAWRMLGTRLCSYVGIKLIIYRFQFVLNAETQNNSSGIHHACNQMQICFLYIIAFILALIIAPKQRGPNCQIISNVYLLIYWLRLVLCDYLLCIFIFSYGKVDCFLAEWRNVQRFYFLLI